MATTPTPFPDEDHFPLNTLIATVTTVIDAYQAKAVASKSKLLTLKTASFDFKTVVTKSGGVSISVFFLKVGGKITTTRTQEFKFNYGVPPSPKPQPDGALMAASGGIDVSIADSSASLKHDKSKPEDHLKVGDALTAFLESAGTVFNASPTLDKQALSEATISLQFGVLKTVTAGVTLPIEMIVIDGSVEYDKNTVQSMVITFSPEKSALPQTPPAPEHH